VNGPIFPVSLQNKNRRTSRSVWIVLDRKTITDAGHDIVDQDSIGREFPKSM
jgi:hypothetical protein